VGSSRTCINFNRKLDKYFSCKRGLRQDDHLSPFLFDLVDDVMHRILIKTQDNIFLSGIRLTPLGPRILNLHFTYDTLLFLEATSTNVEILQWILVGFEQLSGMRIIFSKCERIPFNFSPDIGSTLASKFGCKSGTLPITYLGFPFHNKKLSIQDWNFLIEKIEHNL
jgi:hypothetical protein